MKAYEIKIKLVGLKPVIWRRVIIPADITFKRLHDTIQNSMDWWDYHLYRFEIVDEKLIVTNDKEWCEESKFYKKKYKSTMPTKEEDPFGIVKSAMESTVRQPQTIKIDKYIEKYKEFKYIYDFGDDWVHKIELENIIYDYKFGYPTLVSGKGACPPEDVGGIPGYKEFLEIWNNPEHEEYEATKEWAEGQSYREFDIERRNYMLKSFFKLKKNEPQV